MLKKILLAAVSACILILGISTQAVAAEEIYYLNKDSTAIELAENPIPSLLSRYTQVFPLEAGSAPSNWRLCVFQGSFYYIENSAISLGIPEMEERSYPIVPGEEVTKKIRSLGYHKVTTYCSCEICCGKSGGKVTAAGTAPTVGRTIGCNWLPLGTHVLIEGHEYIVEDRGASWVKGFDIFWGDDHQAALHSGFGRKIEVFIIEEG